MQSPSALVNTLSLTASLIHTATPAWRGRPECNDYSVGIELEGLEGGTFEPPQYEALARLVDALARHYPIDSVAGHEHVAPGRKNDPGAGFDWKSFADRLAARARPLRSLVAVLDR